MKLVLFSLLLFALVGCEAPLVQSSASTEKKVAAPVTPVPGVAAWADGSYSGVIAGNIGSDPGNPATTILITFSIANDVISGTYNLSWSGGSDSVNFSGPIVANPGGNPQISIHSSGGGVVSDITGAVFPAASGNPPMVGMSINYAGNGKGITGGGTVSRNPGG